MPKFSIIVPIYNAEKSLCRCIDSIHVQTFTNWECILVDDGSMDGSGFLCDEYARKDGRFRVIHKENGGVSSARNNGLEAARGEWISFVDADDYIEPVFLECFLSRSADLVICGFSSTVNDVAYNPSSHLLSRKELSMDMHELLQSKALQAPWCKMYKKSIINNNGLRFDIKLKLNEDTMFVYDYLCCCCSVEFVEGQNYKYDGIWGGGDKYELTWDEVSYLFDCWNNRILKIIEIFGCNLLKDEYVIPKFEKIKNLCSDYRDINCFNLYQRHFPDAEMKLFFKMLFPWDALFREIKREYKQNRCKLYIETLRDFITVPKDWVNVNGIQNRFNLFCLCHHLDYMILLLYWTVEIAGKVYEKMKKL